ncbi:4'-phosphopantetheinyl transferase superfamily protein [Kamptonema cortianum]|uniref:4'-phosphopantetheinyl transferase superfamily protein n=1 Tax=Geitlerinema calcuttense NRMC-F 0142 TaxID=2922238 RepID=A0ABT7M3D6_9CYAN|nr:4'-phosphopantetheinyl transferase superfamily protein [Geitlerinema calcuttense]MDK3158307.1 4'-phosphopantetheinyl transferase superfamily protein [Kamptonema cortianum]MDL5057571.1 4'-phosphopantetheinyl transferase superfamily protein [Geitlerinema calcuttense NRMC-F 0142]
MVASLEGWLRCPVILTEYPDQRFTLAENEVQVWRVFEGQQTFPLERLQAILSLEERERAAKFRFETDRDRFILARGLLRVLLSYYTGQAAADLCFRYGEFGKPELEPPAVCFNVSHSPGLILYAVTRDRAVGIDVESIRTDFPDLEIAQKFFAPQEFAMLRQLPPEMRCLAFFWGWTCKEAYIKATGKGLSLPLNQFTVSLLPTEPAQLLSTVGDSPDRWLLQALNLGENYAGALAVEGRDSQVKLLELCI